MCRLAQPHDGQKRLVFTSVGVGIVIEVTLTSTGSESEESECFRFLPTPLMTPSLGSTYDLVKTRLSESAGGKRKDKLISMYAPKLCDCMVLFFCFCLRLRQPSFHWIVNDRVVSGIRTLFSLDRNVLRF